MPKPRVPLPVDLTGRPFTRAEAIASGVSQGFLRGPAVRRLSRGLYVPVGGRNPRVELIVGLLRVLPPGTVVTSVTALQLYGVQIGAELPRTFCTDTNAQSRRRGVRLSRVRRLPPHRGPVALPDSAWVAAATELDLVELVTAGDWLIRLRLCSPAELRCAAGAATGAGSRLIREAAELIRERVDSPPESRLRLLLVLSGLPTPQCNVPLGTEHCYLGSPDLAYQQYRVLLEYEGEHHLNDRDQWNYDIGRYEAFTAENWRVIRVTSGRMRQPRWLVGRVYDALAVGGYTGPPPVFNKRWCSLFG